MFNWDFHEEGALGCEGCWSEWTEECDCGGRIHNEYEDENYDSVILAYRCDKCDKPGEDIEQS